MADRQSTFARIYEANREDLYAYIHRSIREENTSLDILQDAFYNFFRIFQERDLPPDDRQCRMYIFKIARNLMINHGKRSYNARVDLTDSLERHEAGGPDGLTPEDQVLEDMELARQEKLLQREIARLPEDQRSALLMRFQSDMKLEEIAEVLNVSISTASRLIERGRRALVDAGRKDGLA